MNPQLSTVWLATHRILQVFFFLLWIYIYTNKKASRRKLSQLQKCYNYLHCKAVTSQNVSSEAQVKNVLFRGIIMFRFQDIQVWVLLNPAPTSTQLHLPPPSYIQLHPATSTSNQLIPTSTHFHPSPPSSFQPPPSSLQLSQ